MCNRSGCLVVNEARDITPLHTIVNGRHKRIRNPEGLERVTKGLDSRGHSWNGLGKALKTWKAWKTWRLG
jgi:hypothetical protein